MPELIIALDPGGTTGMALWSSVDGGKMTPEEGSPMGALKVVEDCIDHCREYGTPMEIVAERFVISQRTIRLTRGGSHDALDVLGGLRYLAHRGNIPLVLQGAGDIKPVVTDERLKRLGWYSPTSGGHANDAVRHLAYRLARLGSLVLPA